MVCSLLRYLVWSGLVETGSARQRFTSAAQVALH